MSENEQIIQALTELKHAVSEIVSVDRILTLAQAAELLGLTPKILNKKLSRNEIKYYKPQGGKLVYLKYSDLLAWMERGAVEPSDAADTAAALLALKHISRTRKR